MGGGDGISVEEAYDRLREPDEGELGDGDPPDAGGGPGADAVGAPTANGSEPSDDADDGVSPVTAMVGKPAGRRGRRTMTATPATTAMAAAPPQAATRRVPARSLTRRRAAKAAPIPGLRPVT